MLHHSAEQKDFIKEVIRCRKLKERYPGYISDLYMCLIPEEKVTGPFAASWKEVNGLEKRPAYWMLLEPTQNGYKIATERVPLFPKRYKGNKDTKR